MDVSTIHTELKQKKTRSFYIFAGEEWAVQKIYINQIAKIANKEIKRVDRVLDIKPTNKKSFVPVSYVYVVRDDKEFMTEEKLQNNVSKVLGDHILIFLLTATDKRTKFYKRYKSDICEFEPLSEKMLIKYIQKDILLSEKNCKKLIDVCESNYGRILLEIDKIKKYADHELDAPFTQDVVHWQPNDVFETLVKDGTIYQPPKDAVFDFVDAILDDKPKLAFQLYQECLGVGEAILVMITNLYNSAKAVLQVQACQSKDVSKTTGLTGWQIQNARKHVGVYRNEELIHMMELCQKAEKGIKTGTMSDSYAMQYIMLNVM